jgi:hemerythrin-like domain-containing protein
MVKRHSSERVAADSIVEPLDRWHADHRNFSRLLDLIEQEVDVFHGGKRPDYELMRSIIYYMRHYPDRFHHPREDVAFNRLVKHDPTLQLTCARRIQEHAVIAAAGEELLSCLDRIIAGVVIERSTLEAAAATYLIYYRHHLAAEERELIPRAVELLTAADWKAVSAIPTEPDPLFGTDSDERYRELRQQIAIMAEEAE